MLEGKHQLHDNSRVLIYYNPLDLIRNVNWNYETLEDWKLFQKTWNIFKGITCSIPESQVYSITIHNYISTEVIKNSRNIILHYIGRGIQAYIDNLKVYIR